VVGNMVGSGVYLLPASLAPFGGISLLGWGFTAYMYWLEGTDVILVLLANVGGMHSGLSPSPVSLFFREVLLPQVMRYVASEAPSGLETMGPEPTP